MLTKFTARDDYTGHVDNNKEEKESIEQKLGGR
jgi:hypothetical protein